MLSLQEDTHVSIFKETLPSKETLQAYIISSAVFPYSKYTLKSLTVRN